MSASDETPRFVVVELYDDADLSADEIAQAIIRNLEDVKMTYAAHDGGNGRLIRKGAEVTVRTRGTWTA